MRFNVARPYFIRSGRPGGENRAVGASEIFDFMESVVGGVEHALVTIFETKAVILFVQRFFSGSKKYASALQITMSP